MRKLKLSTTLLLVASLCFISSGYRACPQSEKDRNVAYARDIAGALRVAAPIIARKAPRFSARLAQIIPKADRLIEAVAASDSTTAASLVREILPVISDIVEGLPGDSDIQFALALGQIGLNFFINHFLKTMTTVSAGVKRGASTAESSVMDEVKRFKALPQFGCELKPERCR